VSVDDVMTITIMEHGAEQNNSLYKSSGFWCNWGHCYFYSLVMIPRSCRRFGEPNTLSPAAWYGHF